MAHNNRFWRQVMRNVMSLKRTFILDMINKKYFMYPFMVTLLIAFSLNLLTYIEGKALVQIDGIAQIGFPITFLSYGGLFDHFDFSIGALFADLGMAILVAFIIGRLFYLKYRNKHNGM